MRRKALDIERQDMLVRALMVMRNDKVVFQGSRQMCAGRLGRDALPFEG